MHDQLLQYLLQSDIDTRLLPPQIRLLEQCIGLPATFALLLAKGGQPYTVPMRGGQSKFLTSIMSVECAKALSDKYSGQTVTLPKLDKPLMQIRDRQIDVEATRGDSLTILAARYDLTTRQISNILAKFRSPESPQTDLF